MNCIILIGYRGVGKSTISQIAAKKTGFKSISLDKLLADKIGNLQSFIKEYGWAKFREEETLLIKELSMSNTVIDCGGGVVEFSENMKYLSKLGKIFYLSATSETLKNRLLTTNPRLSLSGSSVLNEIDEVLARRDPLYIKYSDFVIKTDDLSPIESVDEIIAKFNA